MFLDREIPYAPYTASNFYEDHVNHIREVTGKKLILPPGMMDFAEEKKLSIVVSYVERTPGAKFTLWEYLRSLWSLDLDAYYDPTRDAVVLGFNWYRPIPYSPDIRSLVTRLGAGAPLVFEENYGEWKSAFDTLLSQFANFQRVWKLRLANSCDSRAFPMPGRIYSCFLKDETGREHLVVLWQGLATLYFKGNPPLVFFYLFDRQGQLEDGGSFAFGWESIVREMKVQKLENRLTFELASKYDRRCSFTMTMDGYLPSFSRWGDFTWGLPSFSHDSTSGDLTLTMTSPITDTYDYQSSVDHGKLVGALLKNGSLLATGNIPFTLRA